LGFADFSLNIKDGIKDLYQQFFIERLCSLILEISINEEIFNFCAAKTGFKI
jgi:hypothetical protein